MYHVCDKEKGTEPRHTYMPIIVRVLLHNIVLVLFQLVNKKMFIPNKLDIIED